MVTISFGLICISPENRILTRLSFEVFSLEKLWSSDQTFFLGPKFFLDQNLLDLKKYEAPAFLYFSCEEIPM